jgi:hypothetical protein
MSGSLKRKPRGSGACLAKRLRDSSARTGLRHSGLAVESCYDEVMLRVIGPNVLVAP